ncbi:serine hydrolase [Tenacibaculum sp. ZS6-P6]|uniref:serine hydrolase n=1 Tax=Tenacibaculum sp. ZS6-P6 TaxID=3447503 RepID=UPI003F99B3F9
MKNKASIFSLLIINLLLIISCSKGESKSPIKSEQVNKKVHDYISSLIKADEIPGMALAIVKDGKVIHKKNYGLANIAHKVPVSDSTLFRLYSTTKLITAVASFQLIEDGKLSLDTPISKYIDNLPDSWKNIRIKHLLTCSSGLPEYKDFDKKLTDKNLMNELIKQSLHFEKGYKYEYNQTNYWFLKLIIEKVTNQRFEKFVKENQFNNKKNNVLFASNSLVDYPNRVSKYQYNKKYNAYEKTTYEAGNRSLAGNGLNTNLNTLLDWNKKLDNDQLLKPETKRLMMSPFEYENNSFPFSYTWGIYGPKGKQYYGFAGGGVNAFMKFIDKDLTIIILSNGFKNRPVIATAITYISGLIDNSLVRKDRMLNEDIRLAFILNDYNKAVKKYNQIKQNNKDINFERGLNNVGYYYLSNSQINKSIAIFKLYTQEYSNSSNAFDSLGEAYFNNEQYDSSRVNYKKSLELDPRNKNAEKMLKKIDQITNINNSYK